MSDASLDARILDWIGTVIGTKIERIERALARREAWAVDVAQAGSGTLELFLRLAHDGDPANSGAALAKETRVVRALGGTGIPVPAVHGVLSDPHAVVFERVPGRSDLHTMPAPQQDAVYRDYLEIMGRLHNLDPARLDLGFEPPRNAIECAMAEVDALASGVLSPSMEPSAATTLYDIVVDNLTNDVMTADATRRSCERSRPSPTAPRRSRHRS